MLSRKSLAAYAVLLAVCVAGVQAGQDPFSAFWGSKYQPAPPAPRSEAIRAQSAASDSASGDPMHHWNRVAVDSAGLDHTPAAAGESRVFGEQLGPGRSSRAMAIVHIAMFDAVNSIAHRYTSFTGINDVRETASMPAALAQAAHDTLVELYPSQRKHCDELLEEALSAIPSGADKAQGILTGKRAAREILRLTANDGSRHAEPVVGVDYIPGSQPGEWQPDPISGVRVALGAHWGSVRPLIIESAVAHRAPPPPDLASAEYAAAFNEVKRLGGDVTRTATQRSYDQTMTGLYWAYDGTPSLCAPPRLYNQMVMYLAEQDGGHRRCRGRATARTGQRGDVRRRRRRVGVEVLLEVLAADYRDSPGRHRWQCADRCRSRTSRRSARRRPISRARTSRRHSPRTPRGTRRSAAPFSRCCATTSGPTASLSRSCPTN